jgi:hypothetical protein
MTTNALRPLRFFVISASMIRPQVRAPTRQG